MTMAKRLYGLLLALTLVCPLPALADTGPMLLQARDLFDLEWAEHPRISPDARQVVYQRMGFDIMTDRRRSRLWQVDLDSGRQFPLTDDINASGAVWSPDGKRLAWISHQDGRAQIMLRWMDSGQQTALGWLPQPPSELAFSPDGRQLAFSMLVEAKPVPRTPLPPKPEAASWAPPAKYIDHMVYRGDGEGYLLPGYRHVFIIPSDGGTPHQVSRGEKNYRAPVWSRDGRSLYVLSSDTLAGYQPAYESNFQQLDIATGSATILTDTRGPKTSPLALSPDGRYLAYVGYEDEHKSYQVPQLWLLDLSTQQSRAITADFDYPVSFPHWDRNGRGLYFAYDRHGRGHIAWISASGGKVETLSDDFGGISVGLPHTGGHLSVAGETVAYTRDSLYRPADLAIVQRGRPARVMTDLNGDLLGHRQLGQVESFQLTSSADGLDIEAWLIKPPGYQPGKRYPLLLEIHGGPYYAYGPRFAMEMQLYASAGYAVLYVNPRGSSSYGQAFADHILLNYPGQDYDDLMSAVDAVIAQGIADPEQLFVTGGSGGGVLSSWIIGHNHRFKAAVVVKPVINWISQALTADLYPYFTQYWFPAMPWDALEHYWKRSSLSHVGKVETPTLLIVGEADYRTPVSETEQYYQALKLRGVDSAMLRIPGASHDIGTRPTETLHQILAALDWFARYRTPEMTQ